MKKREEGRKEGEKEGRREGEREEGKEGRKKGGREGKKEGREHIFDEGLGLLEVLSGISNSGKWMGKMELRNSTSIRKEALLWNKQVPGKLP
jgi:flagellar biosynthesis/type III secretory pathway protein FliH